MAHLQVDPHAAWYVHAAADSLLAIHIGGGTVGLISGVVALGAPKGGRIHAMAGKVFMVAMLGMAAVGATVAPFMSDRVSTVAGFMTLYLLISAWLTVKRRPGQIGRAEWVGFPIALTVAIAGATFMWMAQHDPSGTIDGQPPQAFYLFLIVGGFAAVFDLKLLLRRGLTGVERLARHLWRMCVGLFVASGSLFLGQPQVFPAEIRHSAIMYLPALAPLVALIFWMVSVRLLNKGFRPVVMAEAA
jgi:hypothetical protein